jgi:hypothetical protein
VRLFDRAARGAHVEEYAAIFKKSRGRMGGKIRRDHLNQLRGRRGLSAGAPSDGFLSLG